MVSVRIQALEVGNSYDEQKGKSCDQ